MFVVDGFLGALALWAVSMLAGVYVGLLKDS